MREMSFFDKLILEFDHGLRTNFAHTHATRDNPANHFEENTLSAEDRRHSAGLMRVDHTGEICAQALYRGQAFFAKDHKTQHYLLNAAKEEQDHLVWCQDRLIELSSRTSCFSPVWYCVSFGMGAVAAIKGDDWSYGFVAETEDQVEAHLTEHLADLPRADKKSRAILKQMKLDEMHHAKSARLQGAKELPGLIKLMMKLQSKIMTKSAYFL